MRAQSWVLFSHIAPSFASYCCHPHRLRHQTVMKQVYQIHLKIIPLWFWMKDIVKYAAFWLRTTCRVVFLPFPYKHKHRCLHTALTEKPRAAYLSLAPIVERDLIRGLRWKRMRGERDERIRGWEKRAGERKTGNRKASSSMSKRALWLSWLWSVAHTHTRTHTHIHTQTNSEHVCNLPPTHPHLMYTKKYHYLSPMSTNSHSLTLTLCNMQLCATSTVICRPPLLSRHEWSRLAH